ncbi:metallophosphoesterase [Candidatus Woesearchaeota archaeon]|nr:metallophosphoesterase [Candidatus Woesearchaeota archaeon]
MVEILKGIEILDLSLYLKKYKTLIISDLHLGIEDSLIDQGILIPKNQFKIIKNKIDSLIQTRIVKTIVLNGDIKHELSRINKQEWEDIDLLLNSFNKLKIVLIFGNHDIIMMNILKNKGYYAKKFIEFGDIVILHGDIIPIEVYNKKVIIIGHEHPSIILTEGAKSEKFKCFIKGKWKEKTLIVMPSFNPLTEGTNVLNFKFLSPFIKSDIKNFNVYIVGDKIYNFGKIKNLA